MPNTKVVQNKITGKFVFFETNLIKPEKIRPLIDKGIKPPKNIKLKLGLSPAYRKPKTKQKNK